MMRGLIEHLQHPWPALLVLLASSIMPSVPRAANFALEPGEYEVVSQMIMPHLDEMRRIEKRQRLCIEADELAVLFPVMRQPALRGCVLDYPAEHARRTNYVLQCESARVASGTAWLSRTSGRINGMLEVKMGGKNMTFSQRSTAIRRGACTDSTRP
jgi:hypothetical protein